MDKKGKLELTWVGKNDEKELEPRILVEDKEKSYGDQDTDNMLIHHIIQDLVSIQMAKQLVMKMD